MMRLALLLLFSGAVISSELVEQRFVVDGLTRFYTINEIQTKELKPLIIALHGGGSSWDKFAYKTTQSTLLNAAHENQAVIIFPQGIKNHWNDGRKHLDNGVDDVSFISQLIDYSLENYTVDKNKIYIVGFSNGGFMSMRLAIELSDKITGAAAVSAQLSEAIQNKKMKENVSFMLINGVQDPIVPYMGGEMKSFKFAKSRGTLLSTQETLNYFLDANECKGVMKKQYINNKKFDKTSISIEKYDNCNHNTKVKLITVNGGGHTWPGGMQYLPVKLIGKVSREIDAGKEVIDFFLNQ
jgi:polyhydroxybutyrate depolymerase